jgi:hypothetical protein
VVKEIRLFLLLAVILVDAPDELSPTNDLPDKSFDGLNLNFVFFGILGLNQS